MTNLGRIASWFATVATLLMVAGCSSSLDDSAETPFDPADQPLISTDGPFVLEDPSGLIADAFWVSKEGEPSPCPPIDVTSGDPAAVLLHDSTPTNLRIAVNSGGCHPQVLIAVAESPPAVELLLEIGQPIRDDNIQCTESLRTHEFEVVLNEGIARNDLTLITTELFDR